MQYQQVNPYEGSFNPNPNINSFGYGQPMMGNPIMSMGNQNVDTFNGFKIYDEFMIKEKLLTIGTDMRLLVNGS